MSGFSVGTEDIDDLVLVELLHLVAGGSEVLPGIEFAGLGGKHLADCGCHGETGIGVDVDLADSALCSLAELVLRDTDSVRKLAAVLVDDVHIFLGN